MSIGLNALGLDALGLNDQTLVIWQKSCAYLKKNKVFSKRLIQQQNFTYRKVNIKGLCVRRGARVGGSHVDLMFHKKLFTTKCLMISDDQRTQLLCDRNKLNSKGRSP